MITQTRTANAVAEVRQQLTTMLGQFSAVLPKHITAERFGRVVLTAIQVTPELLDCDRRSFWNAAMRAAQDGLLPDGRLGAMVVYKDRKAQTKKVQWLPMIAGIRQKVRNSGEVATWEAHCVHEKDIWEYEQGDNPHILHRPVAGHRGPVIAAYSIARLRTGELSREWMWREELDKVAAVSKAERGPWQDWREEMYRKTVAKRHSKVLPMSSDLDDLLRRPDEPEDVDAAHAPTIAPSNEDRQLATMNDALDMIAGQGGSTKPPPAPDPEVDGEGEVIDHDTGEYAPSDHDQRDDQLPLQDQDHR